MTDKQSAILVNNPNTKKALAVLEKFARLETQYKTLEKESKEATELIKAAMIAGGVDKITLDSDTLTGYITLAERTSYKATDLSEIDESYLKSALDTAKVKAQAVLTGELPAGVEESKTQYITKKIQVTK
jgi:hypothetical protein